VNYLSEATVLAVALRSSARKITVFLFTVLTIDLAVGAVMYLIEGPASGFTSIPRGVYWAIVTMTTVGYGDIAPVTVLGQALAAALMILGYGIIAVPTGIVSVQLASVGKITTQSCQFCMKQGHDMDAKHCKFCGELLNPQDHETAESSE
jgi:voltage-gated potassium channel